MPSSDHRDRTRAAYDHAAREWTARSFGQRTDVVDALRARTTGTILDLGCGPGFHLDALSPSIGVDLSLEMLRSGANAGTTAQAPMSRLPLARESIDAVWASRSLVHLPRTEVPVALAELHRVVRTDGEIALWVFEGDEAAGPIENDRLPGRTFSRWSVDHFSRTVEGAGFTVTSVETWDNDLGYGQILVTAKRQWSLPDYVGPNMKMLVCGLNPSPGSADSGVGFHRAGNRFWPAMLQAELVTRDRDPRHALEHHNIGMTDLVKRATRRADELSKDEYRGGVERLRHLVEWLQPEAICLVGLAGWRAAVNRKAERGWQPDQIAGRPVYLMPSTSGLNAHDTVDSLCDHMRLAAAGPETT